MRSFTVDTSLVTQFRHSLSGLFSLIDTALKLPKCFQITLLRHKLLILYLNNFCSAELYTFYHTLTESETIRDRKLGILKKTLLERIFRTLINSAYLQRLRVNSEDKDSKARILDTVSYHS